VLLTGCETTGSRLVYVSALPELKQYDEPFIAELADWLEGQPEGSAPAEFTKDHIVLREQIRASKRVLASKGGGGN